MLIIGTANITTSPQQSELHWFYCHGHGSNQTVVCVFMTIGLLCSHDLRKRSVTELSNLDTGLSPFSTICINKRGTAVFCQCQLNTCSQLCDLKLQKRQKHTSQWHPLTPVNTLYRCLVFSCVNSQYHHKSAAKWIELILLSLFKPNCGLCIHDH